MGGGSRLSYLVIVGDGAWTKLQQSWQFLGLDWRLPELWLSKERLIRATAREVYSTEVFVEGAWCAERADDAQVGWGLSCDDAVGGSC